MAEYLAAEVVEEHSLPTPIVWVEYYPDYEEETGRWSLVEFSSWEDEEVCLGGVWRRRIGSPSWSRLSLEEARALLKEG